MFAPALLPAPLMSRAGRARKPSSEGWGRPALKNFCLGESAPKVGRRCTHYWWMASAFAAKSLILEHYPLTKWAETSTKPASSSTKPAILSTTCFSVFGLFSLSFSFVNKEEEEEKAIHQKRRSIHQSLPLPIFSSTSCTSLLSHLVDGGGLKTSFIQWLAMRSTKIHQSTSVLPPLFFWSIYDR